MTKTLKEQVKDTFKKMPFTEALEATQEDRKRLLHIMKASSVYRMCLETSKYHGMYNLNR